MCMPSDTPATICWIERQLRMLDAWRDELLLETDEDSAQVRKLDRKSVV